MPLLGDLPITTDDLHPYGGINIYSKEFTTQGKSLFNVCDTLLSINREDTILDLGCGTGRILNYLTKRCKAIGLEINERFASIAKINNNVIFKPIYNIEYNRESQINCHVGYTELDDQSVDKVIGIALLNHQTIQDTKTIIKETLRITKKNGLILFTIFLINKYTLSRIDSQELAFKFKECDIDCWTTNIDRPCLNSAFSESIIRKTIMQNNGMIVDPIFYGQWNGTKNGLTGHDIILVKKL